MKFRIQKNSLHHKINFGAFGRSFARIAQGALVIGLGTILFISCAGAGADGSSNGATTESDELKALISTIPTNAAQLPGSLLSARGATASQLSASAGVAYDTTKDEGVFGRIMWDLMYNWLLDLTEEGDGTALLGRMFLSIIKDAASDPAVTFQKGAVIDLGVRTFPQGYTGPNGETTMDFGSLRIETPSTTKTVVYWSVPFETVPENPTGGIYYIRIDMTEESSKTLVETRMSFRPNDANGEPMDIMVSPSYEAFDSNGGVYFWNFQETEINTFQQYTDADGMLRTFFNAAIRGSEDEYDLMFLMLGDDTLAGIDGYQMVRKSGGTVESNPSVQRTNEAYNDQGHLLSQVFFGNTNPYRYPLKTLSKAGYTLLEDGTDYWLENDGNKSYDAGSDIDLSAGGAGTVERHTEDDGAYTTWDSGKTFVDQDVDIFLSNTPLSGLDNSAKISEVEQHLADWLEEIEAEGTLDIANDDIITFPESIDAALASFGLPLSYNAFPTP